MSAKSNKREDQRLNHGALQPQGFGEPRNSQRRGLGRNVIDEILRKAPTSLLPSVPGLPELGCNFTPMIRLYQMAKVKRVCRENKVPNR